MADPRFESIPAADPVQEDLPRQVEELRRLVDSLRREARSRPKAVLRVLQSAPYLGQPVQVTAAVTSAAGAPLADCPLTLTTTWGQLRAGDGAGGREGSGLATRTGPDGRVRMTLLSPTAQDLRPSQRDALEVALRGLDPAARTPAEAADALRGLVQQYRSDGNAELRQALDLYFRDFGKRLRENPRAHGDAWSYVDATVFAFVRDGSEEDEDAFDTAVLAMAALPLRFTHWLGPWLRIFLDLSESESTLKGELRAPVGEPDELLGHVYGRVRDFVSDQRGAVGELVGRKVAETTLRDFLDTGLKDLPVATQAALLPALEVASSTLATAGPSVLAAVGQTRKDLGRDINRKIAAVPKVDLSGVTGRLDLLTTQVTAKADSTLVEGLRTEVRTLDTLNTGLTREIGALKDTTGKLNDRLTRIDTSVIRVTADVTALNTDLSTKLSAKADATLVEGLRTEVKASSTGFTQEITKLKERSVQLDQRVSTLNTSVTRIDTILRDPRIFRPPTG